MKIKMHNQMKNMLKCFFFQLRGLALFDSLFLLMALLGLGLPRLSPWYKQNIFMSTPNMLFGLLNTFRLEYCNLINNCILFL